VSAQGYRLEPVEALDAAGTAGVRRIYEDGFPHHLRADFATLTDEREPGEAALALVHDGEPHGFAMLRQLGRTGWVFLRYFVVDQQVRGRGLGGIMWRQLTSRLGADGCTLLVFDVEDPAEPGCSEAESQLRSRRISFYQRLGARLLPVLGYRTPHGTASAPEWAPMLLLAAPVAAGLPAPGAGEAPAIVSAVYEHRWRLDPGHPQVAATRIGPQEGP
jgi:GNAT superfamily N-acetyltransferase